jgi:hypothetical protein
MHPPIRRNFTYSTHPPADRRIYSLRHLQVIETKVSAHPPYSFGESGEWPIRQSATTL